MAQAKKKPSGGSLPPTELWSVGPIINGKNSSKGFTVLPTPAGALFAFQFPGPTGKAGYITKRGVSLTGKSLIRLKLRIEGAGVFDAAGDDVPPCHFRPYFQRRGDDWQGTTGTTEFYRWWCNSRVTPIGFGSFTVEAPLDPAQWGSVFAKTGVQAGAKWGQALADVSAIGFTLGGRSFAGHGVMMASGSAKLILELFEVI